MNRWERRTPKIAEAVDAGGEVPWAGRVKEHLAARGVAAEVSVLKDGTVVVETDASYQKVYPALDALEPDAVVERAPSPEEQADQARLNEARQKVRGAVNAIGKRPANQRTEDDERFLALAVLLGIDAATAGTPAATPAGTGAG